MTTHTQLTIEALVVAVECSQALEMSCREAREVLAKHGYDTVTRVYGTNASDFVKTKQTEALEMVRLLNEG